MKFIKVLILLLCLTCNSVFAENVEKIKYKNLKNKAKITYNGDYWTKKVNRKTPNVYIKKNSNGAFQFSNFYSRNDEFLFSTGTQYEFILDGKLYGYSNEDLKFYEFMMVDELLERRELDEYEVKKLFPKHKIIHISEFRDSTNALKIKKKKRTLKLILLNDTNICFADYQFFTNNSEFKKYNLRGFLDIKKSGMIQFSSTYDKTMPWYIILVR